MPQTVKFDLFLNTDDICLTFQHENVTEIEDQLNLNFSSLSDPMKWTWKNTKPSQYLITALSLIITSRTRHC